MLSRKPRTLRGKMVKRVSPEVRKIMMGSARKGKPISVETAKGMRQTNIAGRMGQLGSPRSARK